MRWFSALKARALKQRPKLRACNPRIGTAIIPLDHGDDAIFFQYLNNKIHSISFEGDVDQLTALIRDLELRQGCTIQKMRMTEGRGQEQVMHLHLKLADQQDLRRVIKLV